MPTSTYPNASEKLDKGLSDEIAKTQAALSFIRRPPLTVKLLSKPPFKFIHDIVSEAMKTLEAVARRLFTPTELDRNAFDSREQKTEYLDKLIKWISYLTGSELHVSIRSILMGKEPECTNQMLQALAAAVKIAEGDPERGLTAAGWVNGKAPPPSTNAAKEPEKLRPSPSPRRKQALFDVDDEDESPDRGPPNIIEDKPEADAPTEDFHVIEVADGRVKTKQLKSAMRAPILEEEEEEQETHGVLVRKILEMRKGIEEMERKAQQDSPSDEGPGENVAAMERQQKERELVRLRREVAGTRRNIQTLSACVTPMSKEMDEVQIAVDIMVQEHAQSRHQNSFLRDRLLQERMASEEYFSPMKMKLKILQGEIDDRMEQIRSQKRSIKYNNDKINRIIEKSLQIGHESKS